MTQKELLYMEDAIGHENNLIDICTYSMEMLEDTDLKKFMDRQLKKHESIKEKLMNALEGSCNE